MPPQKDTSSTATKPPVAFDAIEAPKHRSQIELIRASRWKSVVPNKKLKRSDSDSDDSSRAHKKFAAAQPMSFTTASGWVIEECNFNLNGADPLA